MASPAAKAATRKRMASPAAKAATSKSMATHAAKAATRQHNAQPQALESASRQIAVIRAERRVGKHWRVHQARANRQQEVLNATGTWTSTGHAASAAHGSMTSVPLPPAFAAIHNESCLTYTRQMYEALDLVSWNTCVVC